MADMERDECTRDYRPSQPSKQQVHEQLKVRSEKLNDVQNLRVSRDLPIIKQHPLAVARSELENIIRESLRLPKHASLQPGSGFEKAVDTNIAHGKLSRGNVMGGFHMLMKSADAAHNENDQIQDERWREGGTWDLPDYECPVSGMENDGWRATHECLNGKDLFGER